MVSELKVYEDLEDYVGYDDTPTAMYDKSEVDKQIAELKAENRRLKRAQWLARANRAHAEWAHWASIWFCNTNTTLNINKSSVSQNPYRCTIQHNAAIWRNMWNEVERKCRAKAEEYK